MADYVRRALFFAAKETGHVQTKLEPSFGQSGAWRKAAKFRSFNPGKSLHG
jgi:hypothetical protein